MALKPFFDKSPAAAAEDPIAPLAGTRSEAIQRLQIGLTGLGAVLLLIALADAINSRAQLTKDQAVPEAVEAVTNEGSGNAQSDPLADAGVVPELPSDPEGGAGAAGDADPMMLGTDEPPEAP